MLRIPMLSRRPEVSWKFVSFWFLCFLVFPEKGLLVVDVQKQVVSATRFYFLVFLDNKTHVCLFVGFLSFPQAGIIPGWWQGSLDSWFWSLAAPSVQEYAGNFMFYKTAENTTNICSFDKWICNLLHCTKPNYILVLDRSIRRLALWCWDANLTLEAKQIICICETYDCNNIFDNIYNFVNSVSLE